MDPKIVRDTLLETLLELMGTDKKEEIANHIDTLTNEQILTLSETFSQIRETTNNNDTTNNQLTTDNASVDTFITELIRNMNSSKVSTVDQIGVIDGTLSAIKNGTITITKDTNE